MTVRLTQLDGKLPNLALMKLARHHRDLGEEVHFSRSPYRGLLEPDYRVVYGSAIFSYSAERVARLRSEFPGAVVGGTWNPDDPRTVEDVIGHGPDRYDYSVAPDFTASIGFTARGCRLKCGFCVVPAKEGKPHPVNTISQIWRGPGHSKHLHLLDNDFFGQPRAQWEARIGECKDGGFKVCLTQGINIRMVGPTEAAALASLDYRDDSFTRRRLYTAWDNLGDETRFMRGVDLLADAGIPPSDLLVYMLVGYDSRETWERVLYRFYKMVERDIRPYPMIYGDRWRRLPAGGYNGRVAHKPLWEFQKWAIRRRYHHERFEDFDNAAFRPSGKGYRSPDQLDLLAGASA